MTHFELEVARPKGNNVVLFDGVISEDFAIIETAALVIKIIEPYSIVCGIHAKIIKYWFTNEEIKFLLDLKWWDKAIDWIKENAGLFLNISKLIKSLKNVSI